MKYLIVIIVILSSCNDGLYPDVPSYPIYVKNNTNSLQYLSYTLKYPDTTMPDSTEIKAGIRANGVQQLLSKESWEKVIQSTPKDTMSIFLINPDTLKILGWYQMQQTYRGVKRIDFDYSYLSKNSDTIYIF